MLVYNSAIFPHFKNFSSLVNSDLRRFIRGIKIDSSLESSPKVFTFVKHILTLQTIVLIPSNK